MASSATIMFLLSPLVKRFGWVGGISGLQPADQGVKQMGFSPGPPLSLRKRPRAKAHFYMEPIVRGLKPSAPTCFELRSNSSPQSMGARIFLMRQGHRKHTLHPGRFKPIKNALIYSGGDGVDSSTSTLTAMMNNQAEAGEVHVGYLPEVEDVNPAFRITRC